MRPKARDRKSSLIHIAALLGAGAAVTVGCMAYAGEPRRPSWWAAVLPYTAWAITPYGATGAAAVLVRATPSALRVLLIATVLLTTSAAYLLLNAFVFQPDAQSALAFLFLPFWQAIGLMPFLAIAMCVHVRARRRRG